MPLLRHGRRRRREKKNKKDRGTASFGGRLGAPNQQLDGSSANTRVGVPSCWAASPASDGLGVGVGNNRLGRLERGRHELLKTLAHA